MGLRALVRGLDEMFRKQIDVLRIRHGSRQTLETLINEEARAAEINYEATDRCYMLFSVKSQGAWSTIFQKTQNFTVKHVFHLDKKAVRTTLNFD